MATRGGDYKPTKGLSSVWGNGVIFVMLLAWCSFSLFGFVWVIYTSLKSDQELFRNPWALPNRSIPASLTSASSEAENMPATNAVDADEQTAWASRPSRAPQPQRLVVALGGTETVRSIVIRAGGGAFPWDSVKFSAGAGELEPLEGPLVSGEEGTWKFEPFEARQLTVEVTDPPLDGETGLYGVSIAEVQPYRESVRLKWDNYKFAWTVANMGSYALNSVIVTSASVTLIVMVSAMAAYSITKLEWRGRQFFFYYFLAGLAVPASLLLVPLFMLLKNVNIESLQLLPIGSYYLISVRDFFLVDSHLGLIIIYTTLGLPFTVFVLTGFFRTLPTALAEAAAIDGASEYATFWKIFLPLAKPGLVTVAIFNFLYTWNEYQFALVFISNPKLKTLPLGLYSLSAATQHATNWTALFAGLVILILPTIIIFLILEDRITRGLTVGAVKG